MKRNSTIALVVLLALVFTAGCAIHPKYNKDGSPYWTNHPPKADRTYFYAVGSAKQGNAYLSRLRAEARAKDEIGRWASTAIDSSMTSYMEDTGWQPVQDAMRAVSMQTVKIGLRNVEIQERYTAPDGTEWVLAAYPKKNLKDAYAQQISGMQQELEAAGETISDLKEAMQDRTDRMLSYLENQMALSY